jgi:uncharacterized protein (TIGR03083 family)
MKDLKPIYVAELFPKLDAELISLLKSLSSDDWNKQTICPLWDVKDVVAHLLDTNIRRLSTGRDNYFGEKTEDVNSYQDLVAYLNKLNADWVRAAKRISPEILIALLDQMGREVYELFKSLDPHETALFPVAWAGEEISENWFDIAREYTEHWHHQQQIRLAVEKPGTTDRELYSPVLDIFMRALPRAYRNVVASEGALLRFQITGEAGDSWFLLRQNQKWKLGKDAEGAVASETFINQEIAWRLFTKGIDRESAMSEIKIVGDRSLGGEIVNMLAVMA